MKVLVAGGAGYIGSIMTRLLVENNHDVVVLDNLSIGHREAVRAPARLVLGSIGKDVNVERLLRAEQPECVMHFAAKSQIPESVERPDVYFENNISQGVRFLNAVCRAGVRRFVFSSTASVYGAPDRVPITEDFPLKPTSPYGDTKRIFEDLLAAYEKAYGLRYASLRYFNVAGAYQGLGEDHRPETHVVPILLKAALNPDQVFPIYGDDYPTRDGTCIRDYLHVYDLCRAHLLAMEALTDKSSVYNLGSGLGFTVREVLAAVEKVTGRKLKSRIAARRPGDPPALVASSERIQKELGWTREKPELETMLADAWEFHQRLPDGYPD